ncbi:hypothetical protein DFH05DRAFT_1526909 [Lentinula detonsa]|uniref:Uncharacterized protein n=1 Tax=Lentinula detonsa TaxID=2804962 RepID=A0A9W8NX12_9AGAR|nr:hypothetical protein DFH05DRAFT_1526909 [Lentinula detonsa]KAJ3800530.1 hypothetical protein GGU11DRAFT_754353 [Lentinula aff. detonsa]KAJ3984888.1 hypothetical protein F5890DRAFT_1231040 [Lentinula detonsa]
MHTAFGNFIASVCVLAGLVSSAMADTWGPAFSLGPTKGAVIGTTTTFIPGTPPAEAETGLYLWIGISNGTSGLIQSGVDQDADNSYCGATATEWCLSASYFGVGGQFDGPYVAVSGSTEIGIAYTLSGQTWTQTVTVAGKVVSTLTSEDGPLIEGGWGTGTECQQNCKGTASTQQYLNSVIYLSEPDESFPDTLGVGEGVVYTPMETTDGGQTWTIASITLPVYTAPPGNDN